jgi:hypothetical protein
VLYRKVWCDGRELGREERIKTARFGEMPNWNMKFNGAKFWGAKVQISK